MNYLMNGEEIEEEEPRATPQNIITKTKVPKVSMMDIGKAYRTSNDTYSGTFICDHIYICNEDFYPNGLEIHATVIKPEGVYNTYLTFGLKITFNIHMSSNMIPVEVCKKDKRLLKLIRG